MKRYVQMLVAATALILMCCLGQAPAYGSMNPFRVELGAQKNVAKTGGVAELVIRVPPGHRIYRDMVHVKVVDAEGVEAGEPSLPRGLMAPDPANPAAQRELYDLDVFIEVPYQLPKGAVAGTLTVEVGYQGCKGGLCFMPVVETIDVPVGGANAPADTARTGARSPALGSSGGSPSFVSNGGGASPPPTADFSSLPASADVQSADSQGKPHPVRARLLSDHTAVAPGQTFRLGVHLEQAKGWHTYWRSPGDIGLPTTIEWSLPAGSDHTSFVFPVPERFDQSGIVSYGYDGEVLLFTEVTLPSELPAGEYTLGARADWLVCEVMCIPGGADLSLPIVVGTAESVQTSAFGALFDHYVERHPQEVMSVGGVGVESALSADAVRAEDTFKAAFLVNPTGSEKLEISLKAGAWPAFTPIAAGSFMVMDTTVKQLPEGGVLAIVEAMALEVEPLPDSDQIGGLFQLQVGGSPVAFEVTTPVPWREPGSALTPSGSPLWKLEEGASVASAVAQQQEARGEVAEAPPADEGSAPETDLLAFAGMLALAFIGGGILNIMPCVLPVLTLKLYSLVEQRDISDVSRRNSGFAYSAGIIVSFLVLAAAVVVAKQFFGMSVGWGFQFQYPAYVAALATVVFLFGLSLFGVFEVPAIGANKAASASMQEGLTGYFMTGVFTTLLATPCSAPFLGTGMGFAFGLPAWGVVLFFAVAGLGLASPFLLIALVPSLMRFLPRPGAWMDSFKHLMGFTLMATTLWLLDVLGAQIGLDRLTYFSGFLLVVALSGWIFGQFGGPTQSTGRQAGTFGGAVLLSLAGAWFLIDLEFAEQECGPSAVVASELDFSEHIPWQPFSDEAAQSFVGQKAVFIDFTADWCLTCKVNERTILETEAVRAAMSEYGVMPLKADWTRRDEVITEWLQRYGRAGVPFYLVIPKSESRDPVPLGEVITADGVISALREASN